MPERKTRRRAIRATWGVTDQALSSLMGLGLSIVVAHVVSPTEFGAFAMALAAYYMALGASRALASDIFVVRFSSGEETLVHAARAQAAGTALTTGIVLGIATCLVSQFAPSDLRRSLLAIGVVFPFLLLQDFMRFAFFAAQRGHLAAAVDAVWICSAAVLVALTLALGVREAAVFIAEWGLAAGVAALVALRVANVRPRPLGTLSWLRSHRDLAPRFLMEITLMTGVGSVALVLVGSIADLEAAGSLRGATVLLGPLTLLLTASTMFGVPEAVVARRHSDAALRGFALHLSALLAITATLWTTALTLLPSTLGRKILSDSWDGAHEVVLPIGIAACAVAATSGAFIALRALAAARESLRARLFMAPLIVGGVLVGAVTGGALGAAIGMAIANGVGVLVAWWMLHRVLTRRAPEVEGDETSSTSRVSPQRTVPA